MVGTTRLSGYSANGFQLERSQVGSVDHGHISLAVVAGVPFQTVQPVVITEAQWNAETLNGKCDNGYGYEKEEKPLKEKGVGDGT